MIITNKIVAYFEKEIYDDTFDALLASGGKVKETKILKSIENQILNRLDVEEIVSSAYTGFRKMERDIKNDR